MATEWLDDRQVTAWIRFLGVVELLPQQLDAQLRRDAGLTHADYQVLVVLDRVSATGMSLTELARQLGQPLATVSRTAYRLERRGLLQRVRDTADRRVSLGRLTADGEAKVRGAAPGHVATVRHLVVDALGEEDLETLGSLSDRILARLDPDGGWAEAFRDG